MLLPLLERMEMVQRFRRRFKTRSGHSAVRQHRLFITSIVGIITGSGYSQVTEFCNAGRG